MKDPVFERYFCQLRESLFPQIAMHRQDKFVLKRPSIAAKMFFLYGNPFICPITATIVSANNLSTLINLKGIFSFPLHHS
jgi:hypothetical protein